jgi:hypothetical protein
VRITLSPCQRFARATTAIPARHIAAWLSPINATVRVAAVDGAPNAHGNEVVTGDTRARSVAGPRGGGRRGGDDELELGVVTRVLAIACRGREAGRRGGGGARGRRTAATAREQR